MISPTDEILWHRLIDGNEAAFTALFERYYPTLVRYGRSFIPDSDRVQDFVQDVFAGIWLYRSTLDESAVVKAYLLACVRKRIARFQARDRIFRETTILDDAEFSISFTVEDHLIANEETARRVYQLNQHLNSLPPRQKEALFLRYHHGLKTEQIARILNVNYQSASNLIHRALVCLRRDLKGTLLSLGLVLFEII
ncbi:RNA polymerase sigma factor [Salmonirosea aquatica]|uniref:RNA polymerase sigma factor n=1 Tax=Salmonirosea aquatica TaxID=2654236 RepID=UPI003570F990